MYRGGVSSLYATCLANGQYENVTSGEVCSIATAKNLDIYDPNTYYKEGYEETATFNPAFDEGKGVTAKLCRTSSLTSNSYPYCQLEYGPMFTRKPGTSDECVVYECPPGFTPDESKSQICIKPKYDFTKNKSLFCAERFYDWYTVPNYYLGNKWFSTSGSNVTPGSCMAPCIKGHVPFLKTDPYDKMNATLTPQEDQPTKCISKEYYMTGRYKNTPEYSPIAWIKRLMTTPQSIEQDWKKQIKDHGGVIDASLEKNIPVMARKVYAQFFGDFKSIVEDLYNPGEAYLTVCSWHAEQNSYEKAYRKEALEIAKFLVENEEKFRVEYQALVVGEIPKEEFEWRMNIMKQACHYAFKNEGITIEPKPFLYKDDLEKKKAEAANADPTNVADADIIAEEEGAIMYSIQKAIRVFLWIVIIPLVIFLIYKIIMWIIEDGNPYLKGLGKALPAVENIKGSMKGGGIRRRRA